MSNSIRYSQSQLKFIPPKFNPFIRWLTQLLIPLLLLLRLRPWLSAGISRVEGVNVEVLVQLYQKFQAGKVRFLMAFHHPEVEDPLSMFYLISRIVPQTARLQGIKLKYPVHSHFMYERGMLLWAGNWLGWFFSRLGGLTIRRGKQMDLQSLQTARKLFANSQFPISVAPEGGTNGHSDIISPLEPGVAQLGFWCVEDLLKANRTEEVLIVPIGIQYSYITPPWKKLHWLLSRLEADCGIRGEIETSEPQEKCYLRLLRLSESVLSQMEEFYCRFYHQNLPEITDADRENQIFIRLERLLNTALQVAEAYFGLDSHGSIVKRSRRLEEAGWSYIYRQDVSDSPLQTGLANWVAAEAELRMRHMRLVESFVAVTSNYIREKPSADRFAETTLIIFDMISRIKNIKTPKRPRLGLRQARITIGEPICVSDRWSDYQQNRQAARVALSNLTEDLQTALEKLVG